MKNKKKRKRLKINLSWLLTWKREFRDPKFTTIYTYPVDYAEYIDSPYTKRRTIPTSFNIEFAIPRV